MSQQNRVNNDQLLKINLYKATQTIGVDSKIP